MKGVRNAPQPHEHPQRGPLDRRGNCRGCAVFDESTAGDGGTVVSHREAGRIARRQPRYGGDER